MTVRINWKKRREDLLVLAISLSFFVVAGLGVLVVVEALAGEVWAWWTAGVVVGAFVVWVIWEWLVQDDFGDRA